MNARTATYSPATQETASLDLVVLWSRFDDVAGLWTVLGQEPQPELVKWEVKR